MSGSGPTTGGLPKPLRAVRASCRHALVIAGIFSLAVNLLMLSVPLYMLQVFDRVLSSGRIETLVSLTVLAAVALAALGLLETVRGRLLAGVGRWVEQRLGPPLIEGGMRAALLGRSVGAQPLRDLEAVRGFLSGAGAIALLDAPWTPLFLLAVWVLHPLLGTIALGAAVTLFLVALTNEWAGREALQESNRLALDGTRRVEGALRNADSIAAMGLLPGFLARWTGLQAGMLAAQRRAAGRGAALLGLSRFLRLFVQVLVLGVGAALVLAGELTAGGMIAGSILVGRALVPVEQSIGAWKGFVGARQAYRRLVRLLTTLPARAPRTRLPAPQGRLACEKVVLALPGQDEPVLKGVDLAVEPGEALAIVGPSAAGKSTLCRVLVGTWTPTRGHARLDGADLHAWDADELGPHLGYLAQRVELFAGTVKDNIARLAAEPNDVAVVAAARAAGAREMILSLPQGYDTEVGEDGAYLSGGQRQRIGLARALYGAPRLVVLDEPSASLDSEGETALIEAIGRAKEGGATVVLVAHQPHLLQAADKVLLLRRGAVEFFGPRDAFLARLRPAAVPRTAPRGIGVAPSG